ncbi:MAG: hypothetical protein A3B37_01620 [Candidatus Sungbacteria bacterium RIFCSPLOWO2_01_FULL_59_16]|uniref:DUF4430 domain-containing protein n=1 Tax=Candidatus Sungbacteria bacterium RIFCSPLOWO2_01_FULL_59_16 TaxID=1802280 RepID=A0A1G2LA06_9BACT|nr:MAG: hypothetical protein A3B37_01620 [Candidatus Sungbacteria bacterium RIFCSPLOWO2_01_FULL_59_16]
MAFEPTPQPPPPQAPLTPPASPRPLGRRDLACWVITVAVAGLAFSAIQYQREAFSRDYDRYISGLTAPIPRSKPARPTRLTIDFGNGTKRAFEGEAQVGMTALSALRASQEAGTFGVRTDDRGRVLEIAGIAAGGGREWRILLNGSPIQDLPGHVEIKPGDKILFRYE